MVSPGTTARELVSTFLAEEDRVHAERRPG